MAYKRDVLPLPISPIIEIVSPLFTSKLISLKTGVLVSKSSVYQYAEKFSMNKRVSYSILFSKL